MRRTAAVLGTVVCLGLGVSVGSVPLGPWAMQASPLRETSCRGDACVARVAPDSPPATPVSIAGEIVDAVPVAMTIHNEGPDDDVLLGADSPVAARIEPHHTQLQDGQRVMVPLPSGITIPAGATLLLEAGADHLMLRGLQQPLIQGQLFPLTLRFARAGEVTVTVRVRRKLDAAGFTPVPPVTAGELTISLASAPPAPGPRPTLVAGDG